MKKIIIFLITILTLFIGGKTVYAEDHMFYEGEYIPNVYMSRYSYSSKTLLYQLARTFRSTSSGELAYCIEPFMFFNEGSTYQETITPRNLSTSQIERIKKIAYFGYRYGNHTDLSWYAVAQFMIWKEANPYDGDYYFTETLNGERTNKYDWQIQEINNLIAEFDKTLEIKDKTYEIIEGMNLEINVGEELDEYTTNNKEIKLENGKIIINNLPKGEYTFTLNQQIKNYHNGPITIYQAQDSQNLIKIGNIEGKQLPFKVIVTSNQIELKKKDADNKTRENASLDGSIFEIYRESDHKIIGRIEIKDGKGTIKNIPYGTYIIKEVQAGVGYQLNTNTYRVEITKEKPNIELTIENKIIEKKLTIKKTYGEENNLQKEEEVVFEVYDENDKLVGTMITNQNGEASITLPYGKYKVVQITSKDGYEKVETIVLIVEDTEEETFELIDYKIPVPDTHSNQISLFLILKFIYLLLC